MNTYRNDLRDALTRVITIPNDALLHRVVWYTHANERRAVELLTFVDALKRVDAMRARAIRCHIERMFVFDSL